LELLKKDIYKILLDKRKTNLSLNIMNYKEKYIKYKNKYLDLKYGGKILGKGATGDVYDLCEEGDLESFCKILNEYNKKNNIKRICYYNDTENCNIITFDELEKIVREIESPNKIIVKIFDKAKKTDLIPSTIEKRKLENFKSEIKENFNVLQYYSNNSELISIYNPKYNNHNILGIEIELSKKKIYLTFGKKGTGFIEDFNTIDKLKENMFKFINDILDSLKIINSQNYYHNDVKPPNIIKSGDKYILIDWGASKKITSIDEWKYRGDPVYSSNAKMKFSFPLLKYNNIPLDTLYSEIKIGKKDWSFLDNKKYEIIKAFLRIKFDEYKNLKLTDNDLFNNFYKSSDIYMLGLTILFILIRYDYVIIENNILKPNKTYVNDSDFIQKIVDKVNEFTSLKNPFNNQI